VMGFPEDTYTTDELAGYRLTIYKILIDSIKALVGAMDKFGIVPDSDESKSYCTYLKDFAVPPVDPQKPLDPKIGEAIAALSTDPCIAQAMERSDDINISEYAIHFIDSARRIASSDYLPTPADVSRTRTTDSFLARYSMNNRSIRLFDSGPLRHRSQKYADCFETTVDMVVFVVDLACYDEPLFDDNAFNRMTESLALWEWIFKSRWARRMPVTLLLNNTLEFRAKLKRSPLVEYFPDYAGGNDYQSACHYMIRRFERDSGRTWSGLLSIFGTLSSGASELHLAFSQVADLVRSLQLEKLLGNFDGRFTT